jgi:hypothetical protein
VEAYVRCGYQARYNRGDLRAADGSQALAELDESHRRFDGVWSLDPIDAAIGLAAAYMAAAEDHLVGLARLARPPRLTMSTSAVSRAMFEAAARCWWLLDPAATVDERVARGVNERLYGLREKAKDDPANANHYATQEEKLLAGADSAGLPRTSGGHWVLKGRADNTMLVDSMVATLPHEGDGGVYRGLTAIAHASLGGIASVLVPDGNHPIGGRLELSPGSTFQVLAGGVLVYEAIMDRAFAFLAWDATTWVSWKSTGHNRLAEVQAEVMGSVG